MAYFDVKRVVDIFETSGKDELIYTLETDGQATNFVHRFNRWRKAQHKDNPGLLPVDRIKMVARANQVHISYNVDKDNLPLGKFFTPDGEPYVPAPEEDTELDRAIRDYAETLFDDEEDDDEGPY